MRRFLIASVVTGVCTQVFLTGPVSAQYPSRYDWRDYGKVTAIKSQYPFGTCWAHASIDLPSPEMRIETALPPLSIRWP